MKVLVPIANGSEEIEAVCIIDTLRRAGADVLVTSVEDTKQVVMSRKLCIVADCLIDEVKNEEFDLIALPGGMPGAERLSECKILIELLKKQRDQQKLYGAICAAPAIVLEKHGLLEGHVATCYPSFVNKLTDSSQANNRVVVSCNKENKPLVVTSRSPGTALEFATILAELLYNKEMKEHLRNSMLIAVPAL